MLDGKRPPNRWLLKAGLEAVMSPGKAVIIYTPGVGGYALRRFCYSHRPKHPGKNPLIDVGAIISGEKKISIGDYVWVAESKQLSIPVMKMGPLLIGRETPKRLAIAHAPSRSI